MSAFSPPHTDERTVFELRPRGLRVRTSVAGSRELEAVEALAALSRGRLPQRAFVADVAGLSLRAEVERITAGDGTWIAVIAPTVGRRPPLHWYLLAHEEVSAGATYAVVTRDIKPAARALQEGLRSMSLRDVRPRGL